MTITVSRTQNLFFEGTLCFWVLDRIVTSFRCNGHKATCFIAFLSQEVQRVRGLKRERGRGEKQTRE
jgi:hypothetical protein